MRANPCSDCAIAARLRSPVRAAMPSALMDSAIARSRSPVIDRPEGRRGRQPPVAGVLLDAVEQAFRPLEPGAGQNVAAAVDVVRGELDGHHHRGLRLARPGRSRIRALPQLDRLLQPPVPPRRLRIGVEVARRQIALGIGLGQLLERLSPGVPRQCGTPLLGQRRLRAGRCISGRLARHGAILARRRKRAFGPYTA